jgi:C-terminal processing protease CtpA/Prc
MQRFIALVLGVFVALVGLAWGSGTVRAGETDGDDQRVEIDKRVEKHVKIVTFGGHSFLGVGLEDVEGASEGARVESVRPESAAAGAGIEEGDVITRFDGEKVRSARQLGRLVGETPPGREVAIEVQRGDATRTLSATLSEGPHRVHGRRAQVHLGEGSVFVPGGEDFAIDVPELLHMRRGEGPHVLRWHAEEGHDFTGALFAPRPRLGIRFIELGDQLADFFKVASDDGVLVTSVEEASPAAAAGIKAGDVLLEFDGTPIRHGRDLQQKVRKAQAGGTVAIKLQRDGGPMDVEVTLPEPEESRRPHTAGVSL